MIRFRFNGTPILGRIDGLDSLTLTITPADDARLNQTEISSDLTFYDDGYDIIYAQLIQPQNGIYNYITVEIFDDCCDSFLPQKYYLRGDKINWCEGQCYCTAILICDDNDRAISNCISNTIVSDNRNNFFTIGQFPLVPYCIEYRPSALQDVVIVFGTILMLVVDILTAVALIISILIIVALAVCAVIQAIVFLVNTLANLYGTIVNFINNTVIHFLNQIPLVNISPLNVNALSNVNISSNFCQGLLAQPFQLSQDILDLRSKIAPLIVGCGRKHPTPLVRDYINNVCTICGVSSFVSSVLNNTANEYYNLLYWNAPSKKGDRTPANYIWDNRPTKTGTEFLDDLGLAFNSKWFVKNGQLIFENEYYWQNQPVFFDTTANPDAILERPCYKMSESQSYAGIKVEYQIDGSDWVGNEAIAWYKHNVNYNQLHGYHPTWKDVNNKQLPFGAVRFRNDLFELDILSFWGTIGFVNTIYGNALSSSSDYMLTNNGTGSLPKLLIWDTYNTPWNNARIKDYGSNLGRNYPMQLRESSTDHRYSSSDPVPHHPQPHDLIGNLFDFHKLDDPYINPYQLFDFTVTARLDCAHFGTASVRQLVLLRPHLDGQVMQGRIDRIEFNLSSRQMIISGKV